MNVLAWILGILLAAVFAFAGVTKLIDLDRLREHYGYTKRRYQFIGLTEVAATAGILIGLNWREYEYIGLAAGGGIMMLMVGALITHARVDDEGKKIVPALAMFALSIAFVIVLSLR